MFYTFYDPGPSRWDKNWTNRLRVTALGLNWSERSCPARCRCGRDGATAATSPWPPDFRKLHTETAEGEETLSGSHSEPRQVQVRSQRQKLRSGTFFSLHTDRRISQSHGRIRAAAGWAAHDISRNFNTKVTGLNDDSAHKIKLLLIPSPGNLGVTAAGNEKKSTEVEKNKLKTDFI